SIYSPRSCHHYQPQPHPPRKNHQESCFIACLPSCEARHQLECHDWFGTIHYIRCSRLHYMRTELEGQIEESSGATLQSATQDWRGCRRRGGRCPCDLA